MLGSTIPRQVPPDIATVKLILGFRSGLPKKTPVLRREMLAAPNPLWIGAARESYVGKRLGNNVTRTLGTIRQP